MAASRIEFYVSCKGLKTSDVLSRSDPFAVAYIGCQDSGGDITYTEIGRTETIGNTSDPEFTHQFVLDYFFNETQHIRVRIFDDDVVTADDDLGRAEFTLGKLMSSPGRSVTVLLKKRGNMTVRAEEVSSCADSCRLTIRGINLPNKDGLFGKSDPFFTISRVREDDQWQQVHKSETIMNNLNPLWEPQDISVQALCNGDYRRPLRIDVLDWDRNGKHDFLGSLTTNLQTLLESQGHETNLQSSGKGSKRFKGQLRVELAEIFRQPTLLEFLAGGLQISMMVAIDFTGSNGEPAFPYSLHYVDPSGKLNQYQQAIVSIGAIIEQYDYDKKFPVYGFGGEVRLDGFSQVSHCFPICRLSQEGGAEEADGVGGILTAYSAALRNVRLSGPTLFQEVLQTAMARASQPSTQFDQRYDVLVILTDGIINDMTQTVESLVAASKLPLSVVIVGVGVADFTDMSALDGDGGMLRDSAKNVASRDIVQFVPFSKYTEGDMIGSRLAADTMAEIPGQLLQYFKSKKIVPNPPRPPMPLPFASAYGDAAEHDPPPAYTP